MKFHLFVYYSINRKSPIKLKCHMPVNWNLTEYLVKRICKEEMA